MKKTLSVLMPVILALSLIMFSGCKNNDGDRAETSFPEETSAKPAAATTENVENKIDYNALYNQIIKEYYDYIVSYNDTDDVPDGKTGVAEIIRNSDSTDEALSSLGYKIDDVNIDGIAELLICSADDDASEGTDIFAIYTCIGETPQLLRDSWYRNRYYLMDNGSFFYYGSGGAFYQQFGVYKIAENLNDLKCEKFYFSDIKEGEQVFYTNTTGEDNPEVSVKLNRDSFWAEYDKLIQKNVDIDLTPFSSFKASHAVDIPGKELSYVTVGTADKFVNLDVIENWDSNLTPPYEIFTADNSENSTMLAFMQNDGGRIRDFKLYSLENVDFVNDKLVFDKKEIYRRDTLSSMDPLLVKLTLYGTTPSYAFSYVDEEGTKAFSLNLSGYDGSVITERIEL